MNECLDSAFRDFRGSVAVEDYRTGLTLTYSELQRAANAAAARLRRSLPEVEAPPSSNPGEVGVVLCVAEGAEMVSLAFSV